MALDQIKAVPNQIEPIVPSSTPIDAKDLDALTDFLGFGGRFSHPAGGRAHRAQGGLALHRLACVSPDHTAQNSCFVSC
jgi:hypothetical protein